MSELIEKYERLYFDQMDDKEKESFLKEVENDEKLDQEFKLYGYLMQSLEQEIHDDLKNKMQKWEEESEDDDSQATIIPFGRISAIAAAVLFLMGLTLVNIMYSDTSIIKNNQAEFIYSPSRSGQSELQTYYEMYNFYMRDEYDKALEVFSGMDRNSAKYGEALLLRAKSYYKLGDFNEADQSYQNAIEYFNEEEMDIAKERLEYDYLLFLLDTEGESEKFNTQLDKILNSSDHLYYDKAVELKNELSSFWRQLVF